MLGSQNFICAFMATSRVSATNARIFHYYIRISYVTIWFKINNECFYNLLYSFQNIDVSIAIT